MISMLDEMIMAKSKLRKPKILEIWESINWEDPSKKRNVEAKNPIKGCTYMKIWKTTISLDTTVYFNLTKNSYREKVNRL